MSPALSRRALLAAAGATALAGCASGKHDSSADGGRIAYGSDPSQYGVLARPSGTARGLVVLLHGGFWLQQYGASLMDPIAADLQRRGYATWNLEYRRIGSGGGYPATFADVASGIEKTRDLGIQAPLTVIGHSAGGHLAVWAASRSERTPGGKPKVLADTTISLSGVLDLRAAAREQLGNGATVQLMGGTPEALANDYTWSDPTQLVPAYGSVSAVHARADHNVPLTQSTTYVNADLAAGGAAGLVTVPGDHFDLIDPGSAAWAKVVTLLGR
ncbi:MAG: alpha/beta hydrolase family protein [Marmoricola sp.]